MERNIANTITISSGDGSNRPNVMREIEQLLVHIIKTTGGGGKLHLELADRIVQHRTGRKLSALVDDAVEEVNILEYIKSNLPPDSPLVVNLEEESLNLKCEWSTLDCSSELEDSMVRPSTALDFTTPQPAPQEKRNNGQVDIRLPCRYLAFGSLPNPCGGVRKAPRVLARRSPDHN